MRSGSAKKGLEKGSGPVYRRGGDESPLLNDSRRAGVNGQSLSHTPLREAIRRLEGENILERQRGGTLIVKALSIEDLLHIWLVRILVEGEAARRAADKILLGEVAVRDLDVLRKRL